jgi:hypothetical protein
LFISFPAVFFLSNVQFFFVSIHVRHPKDAVASVQPHHHRQVPRVLLRLLESLPSAVWSYILPQQSGLTHGRGGALAVWAAVAPPPNPSNLISFCLMTNPIPPFMSDGTPLSTASHRHQAGLWLGQAARQRSRNHRLLAADSFRIH